MHLVETTVWRCSLFRFSFPTPLGGNRHAGKTRSSRFVRLGWSLHVVWLLHALWRKATLRTPVKWTARNFHKFVVVSWCLRRILPVNSVGSTFSNTNCVLIAILLLRKPARSVRTHFLSGCFTFWCLGKILMFKNTHPSSRIYWHLISNLDL